MSVYFVRASRVGDAPATLIGLYVANSIAALERQVESDCPLRACEYAQASHGAMYGPEATLPGSELYDEPEACSAGSEQLSEDWRELFFGSALPAWRSFRQSDGHPQQGGWGLRSDANQASGVA